MQDDTTTAQDSILICPICLTQYPPGTQSCAQDGSPLKRLVVDQEDTLVGQTIDDRWIIERKIGAGGMGTVYLATQINIERRVAIKTMHRGLERGHEFLERFLREANVASQVAHPHLVSIHDFGQTPDGDLFIVMEYLDGESLGDRMRRERLTLKQTLMIAVQLCAALAAAHSAGIVHRDLKPDNIFLLHMPGDDIFIKLLDFGIAKHMNSKAMTQTGQVFGTPDYMSPEQCRGKSDIDHRSDLYSLGCILYELISGITPFASESMIQVLFKHVSDPLPELIPQVDDPTLRAVEDVITKLLQKSRKRRYSHALEARTALEQAIAQLAHPELPMPAWSSVQEDEESTASTARLGNVTQEELESLMLKELSTDAQEDELALGDTQYELPPPPVQASDASYASSSRGRVVLALVAACIVSLGAAAVYWSQHDSAVPVTPPQAPDMDAVAAITPEALDKELEQNGQAVHAQLVNSAISTARLLLFSTAHARAQSAAAVVPPKKVKKTTKRRPAKKDDVSIGPRTKSSMERRIQRASKAAEKCLNPQLNKSPELYEGLIGEVVAFNIFATIKPSGEVSEVVSTQVKGKKVSDPALVRCLKRPFSKLKFNARPAIDGVERQGAQISFHIKRS